MQKTGVEKDCAGCGKRVYFPGWYLKKGYGYYCSARCWRAMAWRHSMWMLARIVKQRVEEIEGPLTDRLIQSEVAWLAGVNMNVINRIFLFKKYRPTDPILERMGQFCGMRFDDLKGLIGGSDSDRRPGRMLDARATWVENDGLIDAAERMRVIQKQTAKDQKGKPKPGAQRLWEEADEEKRTRMLSGLKGQWAESSVERAIEIAFYALRMGKRRKPNRSEMWDLAGRLAEKHGLKQTTIFDIGVRALRISKTVGRKPKERRHEQVSQEMASFSRSPSGRLLAGFWQAAAKAVSESEGIEITGPDLYQWYRRHTKSCTLTEPDAGAAVA